MISIEHQNLVDALIKALISQGFNVSEADSGTYPKPYAIGRHEPDIIAHAPSGLIVIGEAKTADDFVSQRSKEQFIDYSSRVMSSGPLRGQPTPFHIIIKKESILDLKQVLNSIGLGNKIGSIITIWTI